MTAQFEYTTGVGVGGGALLSGLKGTLVKGWTFTSQLTTGSGLPLTPVYLTSVQGTGVTGTIRADLTGASTDAPDGLLPESGRVRAARGRPVGQGRTQLGHRPAQFSLNAGLSRTFPLGRAAQPRLADRRDQRAESRDLRRREHASSAARSSACRRGPTRCASCRRVCG